MRDDRRCTILMSWLPGLLLVACLLKPAVAVAKDVTFAFNPPPKVKFVLTIKAKTTKKISGLGTTTDETVAKARMVLKKTKAGYTLTSKPISMVMRRDGRKVRHPLFAVLSDIVTHLKLDAQGQPLEMEGFEVLASKMKQSMPPELYKALSASVTAEAMAAKEIAEWRGRVGDLVGQEMEVNAGYVSEAEFPLPNGTTIAFFNAFKIADLVVVDGKECAKIEFKYDSNSQAFAGFATGIMGTLSKLVDPSGKKKISVEHKGMSVTGKGHRVIDPKTMLIQSEETTRVIKMTMAIPGKGDVPTEMTETRTYSYQYK